MRNRPVPAIALGFFVCLLAPALHAGQAKSPAVKSEGPASAETDEQFLKDAEAGGTHVKQPYVKKFFDTAPDLVATQPQIIYIDTPHDGFGPMGEIQPR